MPLIHSRSAGLASLLVGPRAPLLWRVLFVLMVGTVLALALSPALPNLPSLGWDKLNHAVAFTALAFAARFAFPTPRWRDAAITAGLMVLGVAIEAVQAYVPGRMADGADVVADAAGIVAGLAVAALVRHAALRTPRG